ncbi:MAG: serine protease [Alphaproteobacteria bacterium]
MSRFLFTFLCLLALPVAAQQRMLIQVSSGTGFFINRNGDVITNAHVVRACQSVSVHGEHGDAPATILANDTVRDLAVLHVDGEVGALASLRWNIVDLRPGDAVAVMGYPGQAGFEGHTHFARTHVTSLQSPTGESNWLQLEPVAEHGNSGGPVLDTAGNVIAVITGKASTYRVAPGGGISGAPVAEADVAITLAALKGFLDDNHVSYYEVASSAGDYGDVVLEQTAAHFIVNVRCVQGERPAS